MQKSNIWEIESKSKFIGGKYPLRCKDYQTIVLKNTQQRTH